MMILKENPDISFRTLKSLKFKNSINEIKSKLNTAIFSEMKRIAEENIQNTV
jgi:hypothetical protein